ncbi:Listeria/Bacterioides repeat-containing protein [Fibrobacter sp. UWT3]|uniref:InlB B-repeat-containing protein n=1 Tax=Fibrobacter sp. UWT3 TaxID=1896225 RepID=UPI000BD1ABA7|nr:InlB B-repeat-containing protein [Fibrobacter sp. UWT3]SOE56642.1 Listeria/Bacterioides repeat-containing protein [Fibrobacter sp. UWT3]
MNMVVHEPTIKKTTNPPVNGDLLGTFPDGSSESVSIKIEDGKRIVVQGFARPTSFIDAQNVKYNFMGWAFAESPTTALVADGLDNLPLATRDTTLLAVWTTAPVYTVRFFENDASTASYVSTVYENEKATELTVDKMDPHPGYTFEGWFESGAEKSFDFKKTITTDVNLYAKWVKNSYTVNYVLNCSDECTNSNADEFTVDGMLLSNPEWDEKHRFLGWYADAEFKDKKTSIPAGLTEDITLYAEWDTVTYDITYRAGAYGTGLVASEKKFHNEPYTLRDTSYTRKGYLQSGWVSEEGLTYAFGDEYSANAPLIVYPTWDTISYTITYECNGCDVSDNKKYPKSFNVESKFSIKDWTMQEFNKRVA